VGNWRNKGRNWTVPRIQWKWNYNLAESVGHSKDHANRKDNSYKCLHLKKRPVI
jgi:hypothetical protein